MSDLNPETLSAEELRMLLAERDRLKAETAKLTLALDRSGTRAELLKEAACRALEFITAPNPYVVPARERTQAIQRLEDALVMNGYEVAQFEVRSDAN